MIFHKDFKRLPTNDLSIIWPQVQKYFSELPDLNQDLVVFGRDVAFYPDYKILEIASQQTLPATVHYVLYHKEKNHFVRLDWSIDAILSLNQIAPLNLNDDNILDYVEYYYMTTTSAHGMLALINNIDDIIWNEDPPLQVRREIMKMIIPLTITEFTHDGYWMLRASFLHRQSLFQADLKLHSDGTIISYNHELILEDLPVMDIILGQ
jgi:hypothetical protein